MSGFAQARHENEAELKKEQSEPKIVKSERPKFCVHCGAPLEDGDDFCTECGKKIEDEFVVEEEDAAQTFAPKESRPAPKIASDRMASVKETERVKEDGAADLFKLAKEKAESARKSETAKSEAKTTSTLKTGWYILKANDKKSYLIIESVCGSSVSATMKTSFYDGSYATSYWTGTLLGDSLSLSVCKKDLHPCPEQRWEDFTGVTTIKTNIQVCNHFSGTAFQDKIIVDSVDGCETFLVFARQ